MRSKSKCDLETYINFLKATQTQYSCCELERVAPDVLEMSHDSVNRWLLKRELPDQVIWDTVKDYAAYGDLILDDTLLDKPQARKSDLVKTQYSGKHHGLVRGIAIVTADWSNIDGSILPFGFKIYNKDDDDKTKNDLFLEILDTAEQKGLNPRYVQFDTWYASTKNLKAIKKKGWKFICPLRCNRQVSLDDGQTWIKIDELELTDKQVLKVSLKGYGKVLVCKKVIKNGDINYLATNDLSLTGHARFIANSDERWDIETMHRGLKQLCGIEKCRVRNGLGQANHITCSFIAFAEMEIDRIEGGKTWYDQKLDVIRDSVKDYITTHTNVDA